MTCEHVTAALHDYLADSLPTEERARVDDHLRHCPSCGRVAGEYEAIVRAARTLTPLSPPSDVERRLREALARVIREQAGQPANTSGGVPAPPT